MVRNPVHAGVQAVVQLSEHYANTDTFETSTKERLIISEKNINLVEIKTAPTKMTKLTNQKQSYQALTNQNRLR